LLFHVTTPLLYKKGNGEKEKEKKKKKKQGGIRVTMFAIRAYLNILFTPSNLYRKGGGERRKGR